MRGADREDPVLERLRGVMRVGCSGLCANQPVCRVQSTPPRRRAGAATFDFHTGSDARSEESSRWAATRAAAALLAWACCWRCSGEAYPSTGPERVGGPSTWLWPVHSPSPSHCNSDKRWMASSRCLSSLIVERLSPARLRRVRVRSNFSRESFSLFPVTACYTRARPRSKL